MLHTEKTRIKIKCWKGIKILVACSMTTYEEIEANQKDSKS